MTPSNLLIINYHKIETSSDIGITSRHPNDFNSDMKTLVDNGYKSILFSDLINGNSIPDKPVIISFDDAYESFYNHAVNSLLKFGFKAVLYVPTAFVDRYNDWDVQVKGKIYKHMNAEQIKEVSENGIEIGSHTESHRNLNSLNSEKLDEELKNSKKYLTNLLKKEIYSISYPFGKFNQKVIDISKLHYKYGVGLVGNYTKFSNDYNFSLNRINIYKTDSNTTFIKKLEYWNHRYLHLKNRLIQTGAWATILLQKTEFMQKKMTNE